MSFLGGSGLGSARGISQIPFTIRRGDVFGAGTRFYCTENSLAAKMVKACASRIPTQKFQQLLPLKKAAFYLGAGSSQFTDSSVMNYLAGKASGTAESAFWTKVSGVIGSDGLGSLTPFTQLYVQQYKGTVSPLNTWRIFLYGEGSAKRGRPNNTERCVNAALRMSNAGTPGELFKTILIALVFYLLALWWKQGKEAEKSESLPPVDDSPDQPPTPSPEPPPTKEQVGIMIHDAPSSDNTPTLQDLMKAVLGQLGMTPAGADDLLAGKLIYGNDANIYRKLCSFVFIECLECGNIVAIKHTDLFNALIYLPDEAMLLAYCEECEAFTEVKVSTFYSTSVVHIGRSKSAVI